MTAEPAPEGMEAPDLILPDQDLRPFSLRERRGQWVVMWWFPAAATEG